MIKAVILLTRRDDMTLQDFSDWMLKEHVPLALKLDGLKRYQVNIARENGSDYDGISELWFDSEEAMLAAYGTDHGKAVAADSLAHVKDRKRIVVDEHPFTPTA
ncbi:EthD family reductase [Pelagibius sp. CAU 1746]|uniref:EthD family reductase n=1 Tax=Pelagibius sp. CAU 1746 TaxID=3140370 RepID=UPI00325AD357